MFLKFLFGFRKRLSLFTFLELEVIIVAFNDTKDVPDQTNVKRLLRLNTLPNIE